MRMTDFAYEENKEPIKKDFIGRMKLIRKHQIQLLKPILFIINPTSGRKIDLTKQIEARFSALDIAVEFIKTTHLHHAYEITNSIDFFEYSVIAIVGGDGTVSEAINGMLAREDGQRLPIGLVPNGTSNDLCRSLGIKSVDYALDFILKRETLSIDTIRVLIDVESEQDLPRGPERLKNCRYMMSGSQMSMPAKIAKTAKNIGFCSCATPLASFYKGVTRSYEEDKYAITIDGTGIESEVSTGMLVVNNGKYSGNGAVFNPFGVVNDGLIDIAWVNDPSYNGYWALSGLMKKALSQEGTQAYDGKCSYLRGHSITIRYGGKTYPSELDEKEQLIHIDNEDVHFTQQIKFDCLESLK